MANHLKSLTDDLLQYRNFINEKKKMFTEKIEEENRSEEEPESMESYKFAFRQEYKNLKPINIRGQSVGKHFLLPTVDEIYEEIKKISDSINLGIDLVSYIEDLIKQNFAISNNNIDIYKDEYEKSNSKYKSKIDLNSATQILKMDSYDRNIEENFFIMYYLISYGVIGYFMYKLLKL